MASARTFGSGMHEHGTLAHASAKGRWAGLSAAVLIVCLLVIIGLWTRVTVQGQYDRSEAITKAVQRNDNLAVAFEQYVVRTLHDADAVLQAVRHDHARHGNRTDLHALLFELGVAEEVFMAVGLLDERGAARSEEHTSEL